MKTPERNDLHQLAVLRLGQDLQFLEVVDRLDRLVALLLQLADLLGLAVLDLLALLLRLEGQVVALGAGQGVAASLFGAGAPLDPVRLVVPRFAQRGDAVVVDRRAGRDDGPAAEDDVLRRGFVHQVAQAGRRLVVLGEQPAHFLLPPLVDRAGQAAPTLVEVGDIAADAFLDLHQLRLGLVAQLGDGRVVHLVDLGDRLLLALLVDLGDEVGGEVEHPLQVARRDVEQQPEPARGALDVPDVGDRRGQLDMAHPLPSHLGPGDLDAALVADGAGVADPLVLAAVALPVLGRTDHD